MKFADAMSCKVTQESPPSRGAWIEILLTYHAMRGSMSPPSRGAWIEIWQRQRTARHTLVAPLAGGVD